MKIKRGWMNVGQFFSDNGLNDLGYSESLADPFVPVQKVIQDPENPHLFVLHLSDRLIYVPISYVIRGWSVGMYIKSTSVVFRIWDTHEALEQRKKADGGEKELRVVPKSQKGFLCSMEAYQKLKAEDKAETERRRPEEERHEAERQARVDTQRQAQERRDAEHRVWMAEQAAKRKEAATTEFGLIRAIFGKYGIAVDVSVPGGDYSLPSLTLTLPGGETVALTPHVAGWEVEEVSYMVDFGEKKLDLIQISAALHE